VTTDEAREMFSEYVEDTLEVSEKERLQAFLAETPECAAELMQFERMLSVLHRVPQEEPRLDLWAEFAPRMAEYQAERKMVPAQRARSRWSEFMSSLSSGLILYTHALAERTHRRLERYLLSDPLSRYENNAGDA
jgi:anti-sigma factor RsiW